MSIYTRTGDDGTTTLFGGRRLSKSNLQIKAYGSIDELSSFIGLAISKLKNNNDKIFLTEIQKDLYEIMAFLAGAKIKKIRVDEKVKKFEQKIDFLSSKLPKINKFILPQGNEIACLFHIIRTVCRRAERNIIEYFDWLKIKDHRRKIISYFNRLSDLFFILARFYNKGKDIFI